MRERIIKLRVKDRTESPCINSLSTEYKFANLYRIKDDTVIPEDALDPEIWNVPEGYYAIEVKESLDKFPGSFIAFI